MTWLGTLCLGRRTAVSSKEAGGGVVKALIQRNAAEIVRLHERVNETFRLRTQDRESEELWKCACAELNARFDGLAFPGGYATAGARILAGEADAVEAALCFLELRPYFFRSGYIFKTLLRKMKRAPISPAQADRLRAVLQRQAE